MVQRERYEQYQVSIHTGRVLAMIFGALPIQMARIEEMLELSIFQTAYDPRQIQKQMRDVQNQAYQARQRRLRDARLLQNVAKYSADEDVARADAFKVLLKRRSTAGVQHPWKDS